MPSRVQSVNNFLFSQGRDRKRCQRESSHPSEDSIDMESSRWKESMLEKGAKVHNCRICQSLPALRKSRTINESLKWIKSSLANQKAIYGARKSYSELYTQRQVTFSDVGNYDHSLVYALGLQYNQSFIKKKDLKSDIKDQYLYWSVIKKWKSNISTTQPMSQLQIPESSEFTLSPKKTKTL
ncbi:unnamed protein product [Mytilus edulis]|uniref:Uncharacterized protein n=1 Tax=Mytilus edulis TaxID=6550 RepID=A0A8S3TGB8_MYTED|nr:unnamed protein product [Mytilus edulis]